jgi:hypothetical protein
MNYEERVICFIDILGFKHLVDSTINSDGEEEKSKTDLLILAFKQIRYLLDIDQPETREGNEVTQFSDSIVLSFPYNTESGVFHALLSILWVQMALVNNEILCRGAMVRGKLLHTPKYLFGPGLVNAYLLESKASLYPRVILDQDIIDLGVAAHAKHHRPEHEKESIMNLVKKDSDGMYYIDYITSGQSELNDPYFDYPEYLYKLQQIVTNGIISRDPSIVVKYQWIREKLWPHILKIKENIAKSNSIDDDTRMAYERIPDI